MNQGIYSSAAAMGAAERRLDAIAGNLANLEVHGFKRSGSATSAFDAELHGRRERHLATRAVRDFGQGALETTGNPLDLALTGAGFFAIETPAGEAYTRSGRFHMDERGTLVTMDGHPVAWEGGRGALDPLGVDPVVAPDGNVHQGELTVGRLRIVSFERPERLGVDAGGHFTGKPGLAPAPAEAQVHQGALERSNVSAVDEMVALIRVQRGFESAARMLSMIEQSYRRLNQGR